MVVFSSQKGQQFLVITSLINILLNETTRKVKVVYDE